MTESAEKFELEPTREPGHVPPRVIDELRRCYREAVDYTGALSDALKAQAEKHKVNAKALRRYIAALEGDKLGDAAKEAEDLARLIVAAGGLSVNTSDAGDVSVSIVPTERGEGGFIGAVKAELIKAGAVQKASPAITVFVTRHHSDYLSIIVNGAVVHTE
jgi:hypothetical protein